jgi:hypothetical protein
MVRSELVSCFFRFCSCLVRYIYIPASAACGFGFGVGLFAGSVHLI